MLPSNAAGGCPVQQIRLDYRPKEGNIRRGDDVTDRNDNHWLPPDPRSGTKWPASLSPHDLFKTFVYDKISRRKLSAPFSAFFLSVFYLGENVIEIWMSPLGSKWNIPALYFCWPYLSRSRLRWITAARWNSCTFIRFTHFTIGQPELEKVNYSLDGLRSESLFLMSADLQ